MASFFLFLRCRQLVVAIFALLAFFSATAATQDQCIRVFSADEPAGRIVFLKPGEMNELGAALARNNQINRHVHSVAIFRDDSGSEVTYTVINGNAEPVYKGRDITEMAEHIDDVSRMAGADTVYVSLAGFSPLKGEGMQTDMNIQWAALDAKSKLVVRVPHVEQSGIDVALPPDFYLPSASITKVTTIERVSGPGNKKWHRIVVDFILTINATSKRFTVRFFVRTKQMHQQLEKILVTLLPGWIASNASPAEVVSQVMTQMRKNNPKMRTSDFRAELLQQMAGNRFVDLDRLIWNVNASS